MILFKSIRQKIGNSILRRKLRNRKRTKSIFNFETSKNIGVVFKTDTQSDFELVKRFLHFLSDQDNKVVAVCFIDHKKVPDYYLLRKGFNFFSRAELSFFFVPKTTFILDFIDRPFDMLVDLSIDSNFPLYYISKLSKAKFKIGKQKNQQDQFDVMIDTTKNNTVESLIEQIKHYVPVLCNAN
jgi:hypothetical protein